MTNAEERGSVQAKPGAKPVRWLPLASATADLTEGPG